MTGPMATRRIAIEAAISAAIAFAMSLIVLGPLLGSLDTAWAGGDMLSTYVNSTMWSGFSFATTTHLGFPLGMDLNSIPGLDITENSFAALMNSLTGSTFLGINLLVVLSFPVVATLAYLVIRMTGLHGPVAISFAVAFSLIPYHWGRALGHTYLSTLYSAVVGLALVLLIASGQLAGLWAGANRRHRVWLVIVVTIMCAVIAWSGVYYAAFTLILGAAAVLWRFIHRIPWRTLVAETLPLAGIAILMVVGLVPSFITLLAEPPLAPLAQRSSFESVTNAGALAMALLPLPQSELPRGGYYNEAVLAVLNQAPAVESTAITNFGTWVTSFALLAFLVTLVVRARRPRPELPPRGITLGLVGYLILVVVLFLIPWGLNVIFADLVTSQVRAWNRLLPFLLLLFLVAGATALRSARWVSRTSVSLPLAVVLLGLTALDSVYPFRAAYAGSVAEASEAVAAGREYSAAVNAALVQPCALLQLPYLAYPENGVVEGINDYDPFWTSITNPVASWSYGAVRNTRAAVWSSQLPQVPTDSQLSLLRGAGFCAIHVDARGFLDLSRSAVIANLTRRLGTPIATGFTGQWLAFDLRGVTPAPSAAVAAFLSQPFISVDLNEMTPRQTDLESLWWWTRVPEATVQVSPSSPQMPLTEVSGALQAPRCEATRVTLTLTAGDQRVSTTGIADPAKALPFTLRLPKPSTDPGALTVSAEGPGCPVDGRPASSRGGERRFVQVLDLAPR